MAYDKHFTDINIRESEHQKIFSFRSGMTVYEEGFENGCFSSLGWNGAGFTLNVLENYPTYFRRNEWVDYENFSLDINGTTVRQGWQLEGYTKQESENGVTLTVTLRHESQPIALCLHTKLDGTAILTRSLELENIGGEPLRLGNMVLLNVGLDKIANVADYLSHIPEEKLYSVGYFEKTNHLHEGLFKWHDIANVKQTVCGGYHRDRFRHPAVIIRNNALGSIWFAQLGYSGGYAFDIDYNSDFDSKHYSTMSLAVRMEGTNPIYTLQPGEKFVSPSVHIGMMNGALDDIVNEMHAHIRKSVFTLPPARNVSGGWVEGGIGAERCMTPDAVKHFADTMAMIGAETLILDAGWYCPPGRENAWASYVGDWEYDKDLYPDGLAEIRDYIHAKGLLFGMWAEVERGGTDSKLHAWHPDWFIVNRDGKRTDILDACREEVVQYMEHAICHLIEDYQIDLFRLDYNVNFKNLHYINENGEDGNFRYHQNICAMFERLRKKYPHIIFENCASGGGRTDIDFIGKFSHTWVSDEQKFPIACAITNGMTLVIPPECVDRLSSGMDSHQKGTLDAIVRHTLFGRPTFNSFNSMGSAFNPNQIEFVRHSIDIYKNVIRPFAPTGKIYHHTEECFGNAPAGTVVLERSAEDRSAGVVGIFRLTGINADTITVYPKGISIGSDYDVTFDNSGETVRLSGYEMAHSGLRINIRSNLSSELVIYQKAEK